MERSERKGELPVSAYRRSREVSRASVSRTTLDRKKDDITLSFFNLEGRKKSTRIES